MNDRRIVERLREWPLSEKLALEAADRIRMLEAALAEAERVNIKLFADYTSRVGALEAALLEAETLGKYWQNKAIKAEGIPAAIAEGQTKQ